MQFSQNNLPLRLLSRQQYPFHYVFVIETDNSLLILVSDCINNILGNLLDSAYMRAVITRKMQNFHFFYLLCINLTNAKAYSCFHAKFTILKEKASFALCKTKIRLNFAGLSCE